MVGALSVTPVCLYVYIRTSVRTSHQQCWLSNLNSFDWNFMKLGLIVKCYYVFYKFDMVHIASCIQEFLLNTKFPNDLMPFNCSSKYVIFDFVRICEFCNSGDIHEL